MDDGRIQDNKVCRQLERMGKEQVQEKHYFEIQNRIKNLFWTVSGDYSLEFEPDVEVYFRSKYFVLYETVKQGEFARRFDHTKLEEYLVKKIGLSAHEKILLKLTDICIEMVVYSVLREERPGTEEIRNLAFQEFQENLKESSKKDVLDQVRLILMGREAHQTDKNFEKRVCEKKQLDCMERAETLAKAILALENVSDTDEIIAAIDRIYNDFFDSSFEVVHGNLECVLNFRDVSLADDVRKECMTDEEMEDVLQKYRKSLRNKMMSPRIQDDKKKYWVFSGASEGEKTEEINQEAEKRIREYVELNYGYSFLTKLEEERMNRKFCNGIHEGCKLYLTEGILRSPVVKNNQYRFSQLQAEKNRLYYGNNHWIVKRNISVLADILKKAFVLRMDENVCRSTAGILVPSRLWKIDRTKDDRLFDYKKKSENSEFVIDILLDSSGSQAKRQAQIATQGYIISEALSEAGIPHRVLSYCAFWGYTVLQRFRDYEDDRETNKRIFEFRAYANNRDGLAVKTICASLTERREENKILIILSDGKPCDMSVQRPGILQPAIYEGERAVKDTAQEIRKARSEGISVIGIFVGNELDLLTEKRIFGKDFAYIRDISNFSRVVGTFLCRQIEN